MDIKEQIHGLTEEMLTNLGRLVAIDSQLGTPAEGKPFGEGPAKALEEGLKIAQELGFKTVNLDNYCGYAEMGEGDEIVGIAGHLDIVPVGGDWSYDPFKLTREGDYVYGRGTTDDKGPVLEALYAMKLLRDSGVKLNKRVLTGRYFFPSPCSYMASLFMIFIFSSFNINYSLLYAFPFAIIRYYCSLCSQQQPDIIHIIIQINCNIYHYV